MMWVWLGVALVGLALALLGVRALREGDRRLGIGIVAIAAMSAVVLEILIRSDVVTPTRAEEVMTLIVIFIAAASIPLALRRAR